MLTLVLCLVAAVARAEVNPTLHSVVGDPGMTLAPAILAEGWTMCNRASDLASPHCTVAPRWADCVPLSGSGSGPNGNLVTDAANSAGIPAGSNASSCDAYTEQKERDLGAMCERKSATGGNSSFFWTAMIKSGNFDNKMECTLCGLWCKDDGCCTESRINYNQLSMNQPFVKHVWSAQQPDGSFSGSFYGSYEQGADPAPPSEVDLSEAGHRVVPKLATISETFQSAGELDTSAAPCNLTGEWLGSDEAHPVTVVMQSSTSFIATDAAWSTERLGTLFPNGTVSLNDNDGSGRITYGKAGQINSTAPACSAVLWDKSSPWCRMPVCHSNVVPSYLALEWFKRGQGYVYRTTLRTSVAYPWLMIYTGADAAQGWKGGYPWDGRGIMTEHPVSSPSWPVNDFRVRFWLNVSQYDSGSSFYFLNTGSCWKMDGRQCDGDLTTDVTRYILLDLNDQSHVIGGPGGKRVRCGPSEDDVVYCPLWHKRADGTVISREDRERFPYDAYIYAGPSVPDSASQLRGSHRQAMSLAPSSGLGEAPALWHYDNMSNPQAQDFLKLAPSPEWAQYGFPSSRQEAIESPRYWDVNAGQMVGVTPMLGVEPEVRIWSTFNVGPEMGLGGPHGSVNQWELAQFDVVAPPNATAEALGYL